MTLSRIAFFRRSVSAFGTGDILSAGTKSRCRVFFIAAPNPRLVRDKVSIWSVDTAQRSTRARIQLDIVLSPLAPTIPNVRPRCVVHQEDRELFSRACGGIYDHPRGHSSVSPLIRRSDLNHPNELG